MKRPRVTAVILVILFAGITITWRHFGQDIDQGALATSAEATVGSLGIREKGNHDLAAAFVSAPNALSDKAYQQAARAYEEEKQAQRAAAKRPANRSDPAAPYRRWRRRVEEVQRMVHANDEFPEGSIQWHLREELRQLLQEQPRHP